MKLPPAYIQPNVVVFLVVALLTASPSDSRGSAMEVFRKVAPSIVVVLALDRNGRVVSQGSGVVVAEEQVVTNCHVVEKAARIAVRFASSAEVPKSLRATGLLAVKDREFDLCFLFVDELSGLAASSVARLGSAKALSVGQEVYAVGAPAGLELSLSRGIVSQLRGVSARRGAPLVQTDAAVSPGSSGGGLFNGNGELVGITTFKWRGENLNFALPAEWVTQLRSRASSKVLAMKRFGVCLVNLNYDCVINLARNVTDEIGDVRARASALNYISKVLVGAGDIQGARSALTGAVEAAQSIRDPGLRVVTLRDIAATQLRSGDIRVSVEILRAAFEAAKSIGAADVPAVALIDIAAARARASGIEAVLKIIGGSR